MIDRVATALAVLQCVRVESRCLLCPVCAQVQPSLECCGRIPLDLSELDRILPNQLILCAKEGAGHPRDVWLSSSAPTGKWARDLHDGGVSHDEREDQEATAPATHILQQLDADWWRLRPGCQRPEVDELFVPNLLQIEATPARMGAGSNLVFHILCDRPHSSHRTESLGIHVTTRQILEKKAWLHFLLRLWKPRVSNARIEALEGVDEKELAEWLVLKGARPFRLPLTPAFREMLYAMDPREEWRLFLQPSVLHDHQPRYLCKHCSFLAEQGWTSQISHTQTSISGYMLYRHDSIFKPWERRYFRLDKERRCLVRFYDSSMTGQTGVIPLTGRYQVSIHNFGDDMAGFQMIADGVVYQFRVKTTIERDSWVVQLQKS